MGKAKTLIILCAVLAVAAGGLIAVSLLSPKDEETPDDTGEHISVYKSDSGSISSVGIAYDGGSNTVCLTGGKWICLADPAFPIDSSRVSAMLDALSEVEAERLVTEDGAGSEEFGLDEPQCVVTVTDAAGAVSVFSIGMKNPVLGYYYLTLNGGPEVYFVSPDFAESFMLTLSDLAAYDALPAIDAETVTDISVRAGGSAVSFIKYTQANPLCYTDKYVWFADDGRIALSETGVSALIEKISAVSILSLADAAPQDLSAYGLGDDAVYINVNFTADSAPISFSVRAGAETGEGTRYIMTDSSDMVFLADSEALSFIDGFDRDDYLPDDVCLLSLSEVTGIAIDASGEAHTLDVSRSSIGQGDGGTSVAVETTYTFDGKTVSETRAAAFFSALTAMKADGAAEDGKTGAEPLLTLVISRSTDSFAEMTLKIYPYSTSFYSVEFAGRSGMLVNRKSVDQLMTALSALSE